MTGDEVLQVLAKIQLGDSRQVDRLIALEWQDSIDDLEMGDAIAAVTMHRRESTAYLMPAHVRAGAQRAREIREREERKKRPAIEAAPITLDRAEFDRQTEEAAEAERARKASAPIPKDVWS